MAALHWPKVCVVMAVYNPDICRLNRQVQTIIEQQGVKVVLRLYSDGPCPQREQLIRLISNYANVSFFEFPCNRGAACTFLEGLAAARELEAQASSASFFAFADQDDVWKQDKLSKSLRALKDCKDLAAVHTDAIISDPELKELSHSLFKAEERDLDPSLGRLFFRNSVTGMTLVMTDELVQSALTLRKLRPAGWLHDHFIAFIAKAKGSLLFLNEPTVHYVQHEANAVGAQSRHRSVKRYGEFKSADGRSDRYLKQGSILVDALLSDRIASISTKIELEALSKVLSNRGFFKSIIEIPTFLPWSINSKPLLARLLWCKWSGYHWSSGNESSK